MELFALWFIASVVVGVIANSRGRSGGGWFLLAMLLSPLLAGILALVLPSKLASAIQPTLDDGTGRKCPMCAEIVRAEAIKCRFCGADLPANARQALADEALPKGNAARGYAYIVAFVVGLLALIFTMFVL